MSANKGKTLEPQFSLDMEFDEALKRFAQTKPSEVEESIEKSKQKKPPRARKKRKSPGGKKSPPGAPEKKVVSLRARRMKKRNGR